MLFSFNLGEGVPINSARVHSHETVTWPESTSGFNYSIGWDKEKALDWKRDIRTKRVLEKKNQRNEIEELINWRHLTRESVNTQKLQLLSK